jgi:hypothetical protein
MEASMQQPMNLRRIALAACACAGLAFAYAPAAESRDEPPQVSPDGLQLQKSTGSRVVYVKPGASLSQYRRVAILECEVALEQNWQKNYNDTVRGLEGRVKDSDVERIKRELAAECMKVFSEELQKGGYQVVDVEGPDVLVLRPGLINVSINAPDLMTAGVSATVVRSAGQMTLFLELYDSTSKALLARILDAKEDRESMAQAGNAVANKQAADRLLKGWAGELRSHLDAVTRTAPAQ